jgi:hypothetical protein
MRAQAQMKERLIAMDGRALVAVGPTFFLIFQYTNL